VAAVSAKEAAMAHRRLRLHHVLWSFPAWVAACGGGDAHDAAAAPTACTGTDVCVSTLAGISPAGQAAARGNAGADFWFPYAVVPDGQGSVYVADYGNHQVPLKVDGHGDVAPASVDPAFPYPSHIAMAADGTRYVADTYRNRITRVSPDGTTSVVAGTGRPGADDGIGRGASFSIPHGVALDADGNLYVADSGNARIRKITFPSGRR
jgi:sugar lactone lactonase YvrE